MKSKKLNTTIQWILVIFILIFANLVSSGYFFRADLTKEGRYSVSEVSTDLFKNLPGPALVTVYFAGEMPTRYKLFQDGMETYLNELRINSGGNLNLILWIPLEMTNCSISFTKQDFRPFPYWREFQQRETKEMYFLPFAVIKYNGEEEVVNLIKGCVYATQQGTYEIDVNKAIQNFEYNLTTRLFNMTRERNKVVAFLRGHGEYPRQNMADLIKELEAYYTVLDIACRDGKAISPSIDVLVVAKPDSTFTERELYEIDQYVMRGGKVLWMFDNQVINFDIGAQKNTLTQLRDLNLDYMFLKWGVKVNYDIVQDYYCDYFQVVLDREGMIPQRKDVFWRYHPKIERFAPHPVSRNMDQILIQFGSSIDTTYVKGIQKEVILQSSNRSRTVQGTQFIDVNQFVRKPPPEKLFSKGPFTLGVVLKGRLLSAFRNREAPVDSFATTLPTAKQLPMNKDVEVPKIAIISDGEIGANRISGGKIQNSPFDNKALVVNVIDYLSGDEVISRVRAKEVVIRTLDKDKYVGSESTIQFLNLVLPVLVVILFGFGRNYFRKRKNLSYKNPDA